MRPGPRRRSRSSACRLSAPLRPVCLRGALHHRRPRPCSMRARRFWRVVAYAWLTTADVGADDRARRRFRGRRAARVGQNLFQWRGQDLAHSRHARGLAGLWGRVPTTPRRNSARRPIVTATGSQIAAACCCCPLRRDWPAPAFTHELACVIALGILCTGIAYILYFRLIAHRPGEGDRGHLSGAGVRHAVGCTVPGRVGHRQHDCGLRDHSARHRAHHGRCRHPDRSDKTPRTLPSAGRTALSPGELPLIRGHPCFGY